MGLLSLGTPLPWEKAKEHANHVRSHGITQFINVWKKTKDRQRDILLWGDEIEYLVVSYDHARREAKLSTRVFDILAELSREEERAKADPTVTVHALWRPEYGRFMLEGTPGSPYGGNSVKDLLIIEQNMKLRRQLAKEQMKENEVPITLVSFPRLGCEAVIEPHFEPRGPVAQSIYVPDEVINPHARFRTLTANIRCRRGSKVDITLPLFIEKSTPRPFVDPTIPPKELQDANIAPTPPARPDTVYMDAMAFGMGCCCLQLTFQACNVEEARRLNDQLAVLAPVMLALTAGAPIWRGLLADVDCRWDVISMSVDDRTEEERGLKVGDGTSGRIIPKSRYDSVSCFISTDATLRPEYNDIPLVVDEEIVARLKENGVDDLLARHVGHLFIRDPLVVFQELLDQDDNNSTDHFENIQSTNWQTVRFKPPPHNSPIGWRVEFRSMEVQISDRENAAFSIFVVLVTRAILSFGLNLYIPISKVDENMRRAQRRDAVLREKFWFRKDPFSGRDGHTTERTEDEYELMSMAEIINGKEHGFPGLGPLVCSYLENVNMDIESRCELSRYLELIKRRADGTLMTAAAWIRRFVRTHPDYKHDSVVTKEINYDLVRMAERINSGEVRVPELLGNQCA